MMNNHKAIAFFSGFPERRFTDEIAERLGKELTVRRCIVFITACPADYQQNDEDSAGMHGMFEEYGIGFDRFCVVDATDKATTKPTKAPAKKPVKATREPVPTPAPPTPNTPVPKHAPTLQPYPGEKTVAIEDYEAALGLGNIQIHVGVCFE